MQAVVVAGFGPAGLGVLTGALWGGVFDDLLAAGVTAVDERAGGEVGDLGRFGIDSDSTVESFVAALGSWQEDRFVPRDAYARDTVAALGPRLQEVRGGAVPLRWAGELQGMLRDMVLAQAARRGYAPLRTGCRVTAARQIDDGWRVHLEQAGRPETIDTSSLVLATGARQRPEDLAAVEIGGVRLATVLPGRLVGSDEVLRDGGAGVFARLAGPTRPRVAIVGASHSALAAANVLLRSATPFDDAGLTVVHRQPLRPMYPTPELARADGFTAFGDDDVCPRTGRVFPLAGFRSSSRELLLNVLGLGGRPVEGRVRLWPMTEHSDADTLAMLQEQDVVVLATGYRRARFPLLDRAGDLLAVRGLDSPGRLVDDRSRVATTSGRVLDGLFATGLNAGFPLGGTHGEPSFTGVANGTSLWQTEIGEQIARAAVRRHHRAAGGGVQLVHADLNARVLAGDASLDAAVADRVLEVLAEAIRRRGRATFIGSAGRTPAGVYRELASRRSELDWSRVNVVQMDDYADVAPGDPRSLAAYLDREVVQPLGVGEFLALNGDDGRPVRSWPEHEDLARGCDLILHGIGRNGHLGFNEPGSGAGAASGRVDLAATTVADNGVGFTRGVTLGMGCLLTARHAIVMARGEAKAPAVAGALTGPVGAHCPASWLRTAGTTVEYFLDPGAASLALGTARLSPSPRTTVG